MDSSIEKTRSEAWDVVNTNSVSVLFPLMGPPIIETEGSEALEKIHSPPAFVLSYGGSNDINESVNEDSEDESWKKDYSEYKNYNSMTRMDEYSSGNDSDDETGKSNSQVYDDDSDFSASDSDSSEEEDAFENSTEANLQIQSTQIEITSMYSVVRNGQALCPFPPPQPKRGIKRKRKHKDDSELELSKGNLNLVQLLRTRTTLHPVSDDFLNETITPSSSFNTFKSAYSRVLTTVSNWRTSEKLELGEDVRRFISSWYMEFITSSLMLQLKHEYFYWAQKHDQVLTQPSLLSCWKTVYNELIKRHPVWSKYDRDVMEDAAVSCLTDLRKISSGVIHMTRLLREWREDIDKILVKKLYFINKFRCLEAEIELKDKKLDEFCHWGKKALHTLFSAPYFKLSTFDYTNLVSPQEFLGNLNNDAFISERKQKWTNNDIVALKRTIKDVILDKQYASLVRRYNYLISRITYERTHRLGNEEAKIQSNQRQLLGRDSLIYDELGHGITSKRGNPRVNMKKRVADCEYAKTEVRREFDVRLEAGNLKCYKPYIGTAKQFQKWFQDEESSLRRRTYENLMANDCVAQEIDWFKVAERITTETGKDRTSKDCRLVWLHDANPKITNKRWSSTDVEKLMELGKNHNLKWDQIASLIGGKTAYQCFFKYRNREVQTLIMKWDKRMDNRVQEVLLNEGPKWGRAVKATADVRATKQQVQERWKKTSNPMLRNGAFTRVEDALLLLSMEKLRRFIQAEGHFGILISYLPWRFETVWRDRASNIFSNWIVPWTIEEDKKLMELAESQGDRKNWQHISEQFTSFKNRKGCLTRHKIITGKIGTGEGQFKSLEEYHEAYSMTRYNVFQYPHLPEIIELLERIKETKLPREPFPGLNRDSPPSELELRWMLLDFDRDIMEVTIRYMKEYANSRDGYWKKWMNENGDIKKTFDRRKFHRDDPKSVASAVHMRLMKGLQVLPEDQVVGPPLSPFESSVYYHYARFCRTKSLHDIDRPCIPSAKKLSKLPEISRIVRLSFEGNESEVSGSDWDEESAFTTRKRGRPRKSMVLNKSETPGRNSFSKSRMSKTRHQLDSSLDEGDNFDEPNPRKKRRGRPRKSNVDSHSTIKSPLLKESDTDANENTVPLRRSLRSLARPNYRE